MCTKNGFDVNITTHAPCPCTPLARALDVRDIGGYQERCTWSMSRQHTHCLVFLSGPKYRYYQYYRTGTWYYQYYHTGTWYYQYRRTGTDKCGRLHQ